MQRAKMIRKFCGIFLLLLALLLSACSEKIPGKDSPVSEGAEMDTGAKKEVSQAELIPSGTKASENNSASEGASDTTNGLSANQEEEDVMQPPSLDPMEILKYAHIRDYRQPLYAIQPANPLHINQAQYFSFDTIDRGELEKYLPEDEYTALEENPHLFEGKNTNNLYLLDSQSFWFGTPRFREGSDEKFSYGNIIQSLKALDLAYRRVLTAPQKEELPGLSRADAETQARDFFKSFGLSDLVLRAHYTIRDPQSDRAFYYLQFMQAVEGVPLTDSFGAPYFSEQDDTGINNPIDCVFDGEGLAYASAQAVRLQTGDNEITILTIEDILSKVQAQLDQVIVDDGIRVSIDSIELIWGGTVGIRGNLDDAIYDLIPYYLVVTRESGQEAGYEDIGDRFRIRLWDAQTGELIQ